MIIALLFFFIFFYSQTSTILCTYVKACLSWLLYMYFALEFLSIFDGISFFSILSVWLIIDIILFLLILKRKKFSIILQVLKQIKSSFIFDKCFLLCNILLCVISIVTLFLSITTVTNNYDAMTYRLPRIMHWVQNGTVAHYASNSVRQITSPNLAEFINLHVYLLTGNRDTLFNLLQWFTYITNTLFIMGISRKLKCSPSMCYLSGLLFMTAPIAFAESLTTQNDLVSAMFLLFFVYTILDLYDCPNMKFNKSYIQKTVILSLCIAMSYLTKPSVMFGIFIFALGLLIICIKRHDSIAVLLKLLGCSCLSIIVVIAPEVTRNLYTFHALSDPIAGALQLVGTLKPKYLIVNFLKNFLYNASNNYYNNITIPITSLITKLSIMLNVDINDPSIAEHGTEFIMQNPALYQHDVAVNPIIFWSFILAIILVLFMIKKIHFTKQEKTYMILSICSFCFFCVFLRWERFITRYFIAYLALLCVTIPILLYRIGESLRPKKAYYHAGIGILFFISSIEFINMATYHYNQSLTTWHDMEYFHSYGENTVYLYDDIVHYFQENNCKKIGLLTSEVSFEYPLWAMLLDDDVHMECIDIPKANATAIYEDDSFQPDCIFADRRCNADTYTYHGITYYKSDLSDGTTSLYIIKK